MILATARLNLRDPDLIDTTVKSATLPEGKILAPTWELVAGIKLWQAQNSPYGKPVDLNDWFSGAAPLTWEQYTEQYLHLLRVRFNADRRPFLSILNAERRVLGCFCADCHHCHRTLAVDVLVKIAGYSGIDVEYIGDLSPVTESFL